MTKIKFGEGFDDSKMKLDVKSVDAGNLNVEVGDIHDRAAIDARIEQNVKSPDKKKLNGDGGTRVDEAQRLNSILVFASGLVLIGVILTLIVVIPNPTHSQAQAFSVVLALAAGGFCSFLPGMLNVKLGIAKKVAIGATGALAVFIIVYFFVPAMA